MYVQHNDEARLDFCPYYSAFKLRLRGAKFCSRSSAVSSVYLVLPMPCTHLIKGETLT
jgi:hypothetical protein